MYKDVIYIITAQWKGKERRYVGTQFLYTLDIKLILL